MLNEGDTVEGTSIKFIDAAVGEELSAVPVADDVPEGELAPGGELGCASACASIDWSLETSRGAGADVTGAVLDSCPVSLPTVGTVDFGPGVGSWVVEVISSRSMAFWTASDGGGCPKSWSLLGTGDACPISGI